MNASVLFATFGLAFVLQGCELPWNNDKQDGPQREPAALAEKEESAAKKKEAAVSKKESSASCMDGKFSCSGAKEWCSEQGKKCGGGSGWPNGPKSDFDCTPQCSWKCSSPKCDQTCEPECAQPVCSTRCKGFNMETCKMKCDQPKCTVVCPKYFCPNNRCAKCKTTCGEPVCKMTCGDGDDQPCRNVCAQPVCNWKCKEPTECPKPKCKMTCNGGKTCQMNKVGAKEVPEMPPLEPGETDIAEYAEPAMLLMHAKKKSSLLRVGSQSKVSAMRVNITTMAKDKSLQERQVELPLENNAAVGSMWASVMVQFTHPDGKVTQNDASCKDGKFQCQGDAAWCAEQKKASCAGVQPAFMQQRARTQAHLQA